MQPLRRLVVSLCLFAAANSASGQIAFSTAGSIWSTSGSFVGNDSTGQLAGGGAYYAAGQADPSTYVFGLLGSPVSGTPLISNYNLSGTSLSSPTNLTLRFTGLSAAPDFVAYTGGDLQAYSYSDGTLTLTVSTINPVASASDPTGGTLGSSFGLMIRTGSTQNYGGTVFRTDLYWNDLRILQNYSGTDFIAGLNAAGQNGTTATFAAYLPLSFLNAQGIASSADFGAYVQKSSGSGIPLSGLTRNTFTSEATTFDFNGGGVDSFVLATYSNSSWSDGNIGISAIPEPSTYAALLGAGALLIAWRRRRTT
jgi:hypothetical protein